MNRMFTLLPYGKNPGSWKGWTDRKDGWKSLLLTHCGASNGLWNGNVRTLQETNNRSPDKGMMTTNEAMDTEGDQKFLLQLLQIHRTGTTACTPRMFVDLCCGGGGFFCRIFSWASSFGRCLGDFFHRSVLRLNCFDASSVSLTSLVPDRRCKNLHQSLLIQ